MHTARSLPAPLTPRLNTQDMKVVYVQGPTGHVGLPMPVPNMSTHNGERGPTHVQSRRASVPSVLPGAAGKKGSGDLSVNVAARAGEEPNPSPLSDFNPDFASAFGPAAGAASKTGRHHHRGDSFSRNLREMLGPEAPDPPLQSLDSMPLVPSLSVAPTLTAAGTPIAGVAAEPAAVQRPPEAAKSPPAAPTAPPAAAAAAANGAARASPAAGGQFALPAPAAANGGVSAVPSGRRGSVVEGEEDDPFVNLGPDDVQFWVAGPHDGISPQPEEVDASAEQPVRVEHARRVLCEIVDSEQSYLTSLLNCITFYMDPVMKDPAALGLEPRDAQVACRFCHWFPPALTGAARPQAVFSTLKPLAQFHALLCADLKRTVPPQLRAPEARGAADAVGVWSVCMAVAQLLIRYAPFFKVSSTFGSLLAPALVSAQMYTHYIRSYGDAVALLDKASAATATLAAAVLLPFLREPTRRAGGEHAQEACEVPRQAVPREQGATRPLAHLVPHHARACHAAAAAH
jgi:hypothetical protein